MAEQQNSNLFCACVADHISSLTGGNIANEDWYSGIFIWSYDFDNTPMHVCLLIRVTEICI